MDGLHETERNQKLIADITDEQECGPKLYLAEIDYSYIIKYKTEINARWNLLA